MLETEGAVPAPISETVHLHCTVKDAVPLTLPEVAVIVALPEPTPVAKPALVIVAIVLSLEVQVAEVVMICVVLFE